MSWIWAVVQVLYSTLERHLVASVTKLFPPGEAVTVHTIGEAVTLKTLANQQTHLASAFFSTPAPHRLLADGPLDESGE